MRRLWLIIIFSAVLLTLLWLGWFSLRFFFTPIVASNQPLKILVSPGMTITQLAENLYGKGLLKDPHYFILLAKLRGQLTQLKAGEYLLAPDATPSQLLKKLVKGDILLHKITFVEGWTFQQIQNALAANPALTKTLQNQSPQDIMALLGHPGESPEGQFYPDTYLFSYGVKDSKILRMSFDLMQKKLNKAWQNRDPRIDAFYRTPYQALIVASMIEKETALPKERPLIAGVIINRLQKGMRLQIDATVIYGLTNKHPGGLTHTDLMTDTPYNTYTRSGLPPTPIAVPGITSIEAALHPSITKALYYVAKGDGSHVFSNDLHAHHLAVQRYLLTRKLALTIPYCVSSELMQHLWKQLGSLLPKSPLP